MNRRTVHVRCTSCPWLGRRPREIACADLCPKCHHDVERVPDKPIEPRGLRDEARWAREDSGAKKEAR